MNELTTYKSYGDKSLIYKQAPHLYTFYVYLAHTNAWQFINRNKLTEDQINVMKEIGCFKPSRYELGTKRYPPMYFTELPLS